MESGDYAIVFGSIITLGAVCTAVWSVLRLNRTIKDQGAKEQRILDSIKSVDKEVGYVKKSLEGVKEDMVVIKSRFEDFSRENQDEHHKMRENMTKNYHELMGVIRDNSHDLENRVTKLEAQGCKPTRVAPERGK